MTHGSAPSGTSPVDSRPDAGGDRAAAAREAALAAFAIVLVLARSTLRHHVVDLPLWDEATYIHAGVDLLRSGLPAPDWGPLYSIWYWVQSLVVRDRIALPYVNWSLLLLASLLTASLVARSVGFGPLARVVVVTCLSVLSLFEGEQVHVTMLAGVLVGVASVVAARARTVSRGTSGAAAVLAVGAFVRPELTFAFLLSAGASMIAAFRERAPARALLARVLLPCATFAALALPFGVPLSRSRSFLAFSQHYALNVANSGEGGFNPWTECGKIVSRDFGPVQSVGEALKSNPRAFAWHAWTSTSAIPAQALHVLHALLPVGPWVREIAAYALAALVLAGLACAAIRVAATGRLRGAKEHDADPLARPVSDDDRELLSVSIVASCVLAASFASMALAFPRSYHFRTPALGVLAVSLCGYRAVGKRIARWRVRPRWAWAVAAAVAVALPGRMGAAPWYASLVRPERPTPLPGVQAATVFADHRPRGHVVVLETWEGFPVYGGWDYANLDVNACAPFERCLSDRRFDALVLTDRMVSWYASARDTAFLAFIADPWRSGFSAVPGGFLFVRSDVLPSERASTPVARPADP